MESKYFIGLSVLNDDYNASVPIITLNDYYDNFISTESGKNLTHRKLYSKVDLNYEEVMELSIEFRDIGLYGYQLHDAAWAAYKSSIKHTSADPSHIDYEAAWDTLQSALNQIPTTIATRFNTFLSKLTKLEI